MIDAILAQNSPHISRRRSGARRRPGRAPSPQTIAAVADYRADLFAFAEGAIPWETLLARLQAVRRAVRADRGQVPA